MLLVSSNDWAHYPKFSRFIAHLSILPSTQSTLIILTRPSRYKATSSLRRTAIQISNIYHQLKLIRDTEHGGTIVALEVFATPGERKQESGRAHIGLSWSLVFWRLLKSCPISKSLRGCSCLTVVITNVSLYCQGVPYQLTIGKWSILDHLCPAIFENQATG